MTTRRRKAARPVVPAFEFLITQDDISWGTARELHPSAVAAHAIARQLEEQGIRKADIEVSELLDHISIVADGKRIL